ncbi:MAG: hypothetical protein ACKVTZ_10660 [Bacteroidia bacterium]
MKSHSILFLSLFAMTFMACEQLGLAPGDTDYRESWIGTYKCNTACSYYNVLDQPQQTNLPDEIKEVVVTKGDNDSTVVVNGKAIVVLSGGSAEIIKDYNSSDPKDYIRISFWNTKKTKKDSIFYVISNGSDSQWDACRYKGEKQ